MYYISYSNLIFNLKIIWIHLHEEVRIIIKKVEVYNQFNIQPIYNHLSQCLKISL
jgi:hypothetical protein